MVVMEGLAKGKGMKTGKDAVAEIVGLLLAARTYAHLAHLKTPSYAQHEALGCFYDGIVGMADSIAEVAQGKWGKLEFPVKSVIGNVDKPIQVLEGQMEEICDLARGCNVGALKNLFDGVEELYLSTLYKLRELS